MALTRITKGVIKPNENYDTHNINSTGIVTAIGLDVNGNGDISGNLNVGGVLTYEDVTSIDSVGVITARSDLNVDGHTNLDNVSVAGVTTFSNNVHVGTGITFETNGQATFSGITTSRGYEVNGYSDGAATYNYVKVGRLKIYDNGSNNHIFNGYAVPLYLQGSHLRLLGNDILLYNTASSRYYFRGQNLGAASLYWAGSYNHGVHLATTEQGIEITGHSELDNVSIAGVTSCANSIHLNQAVPEIKFNSTTHENDFRLINYQGNFIIQDEDALANRLVIESNGDSTFQRNVIVSGNIDVDGHTNLDNVSIAGVVTATSFVGALPITGDTNNRLITATGSGGLNGEANLTFSGSVLGLNQPSVDSNYVLDANGGGIFTKAGTFTSNDFNKGHLTVRNTTASQGAFLDLRAASSGGALGVIAKIGGFNTYSGMGYDGALTFSTRQNSTNTMVERLRINSSGNVSIVKDLDVDGHTNLDNVSIAGVTTMSGNLTISNTDPRIIFVDTNNNPDFTLHANGGAMQVENSGSGTQVKLESSGSTRLFGNVIANKDLDVDGHTELDNVNISGVSTYAGQARFNGELVGSIISVQNSINMSDKLIHSGDPDTCVRFPANDTFSIETGGNEVLNITYNRIGLNGTIPTASHANVTSSIHLADSNTILSRTGNQYFALFQNLKYTSADAVRYLVNGYASAYAQNTGSHRFYTVGNGTGNTNATVTERFRIANDGKVTLGTTTPSSNSAAYMFTVADPTNSLGNCGITIRAGTGGGSNTNQGSIFYSNATSGTGEYAGYLQYNHNDNWFRIGTNSGERFRITSDGKIGINDDAPERTMDVKGSNCMIQLEGTAGSGRQWSLCSTDNATGTAVDGGPSGSFAIYDDTSGNARLRIDSGGNARFLVSGGSFTAEGTGAYGMSIHNHNSPSMGHLFIFGDNGLIRFRNSSSVYTAQMGYNESTNALFLYNQEGGTYLSIIDDGVKISDNEKFLCGNDQDLEIYHNNSNAFIKNGTGQLLYRSGQHVFENAAGSVENLRIKSDGRVSINDGSPSSAETLTIRPLGNVACDVSLKMNHSTDSRIKFYDDGGVWRGAFGFTNYANNTTYPNFHDSFYMMTDPSSNGTLATVMRINREGAFMFPRQPCFSVAMSNNYTTSTSHTANFDTERFDQGDNFNTGSNGIFTAPVTGKYYMHAAIQTQAGGTASQPHIMGVAFTVNGSIQTSKGSGDQYLGRNDSYYITVHAIRILNLAQGDTVQVYILLHGSVAIEGSGGIDRCNWQGYLMA